MSEYWVSKNKYYCKYCEIYIADDAPSRSQHENGLRHKGNKERFVRNLYKTSEKKKQDAEEEQREMARVERAAQAAFARDVGAGLAKGSSGPSVASSSAAATAKKPAAKPASPWANYSTAESLGYVDPDAERAKAEAERRKTQGVAGEWQLVQSTERPVAPEVEAEEGAIPAETAVGQKRVAEAVDEDEDAREFKLRKKTVGPGLGQIYDPGLIPIKLKTKKEEPSMEGASAQSRPSETNATNGPRWTSSGWKRPGESAQDVKQEDGLDTLKQGDVSSKAQEGAGDVKQEEVALKVEESETKAQATTEAPVFRKRKVPAGGGRGRRA
ncbi:hypothetical protein PUNSTDRAFT_98839 [Punctularia strigosozonata HHB-11173 SS5]|uniref:uncharacterized protein n=1 Tax=Punctularia strigosozonata (strain HHB-11173) TaxID=741275 RepID=UPI00044180E3|nr:uncharacterized protein PUNSTDRAFT_98839 [Punctularia strigosozonata HHB-11173 SS5]EIN11661.1 hypothetical protein PUNSTDRAFT_98839 [Punctularia strigosozonata HHB-11173 SS5]